MHALSGIITGALMVLTAGCAATSHHDAQARSADSVTVVAVRSSLASSVRPSASATAPRPAAATVRLVVRPVTAGGSTAAGYRTGRHLDESVTCAPGDTGSLVSVDSGVDACSPAALYPVACWPSATPHTTLCYRNPFDRQVDLLAVNGSVPASVAPAVPSPLGLVLSDGRRCTIRGGGAWAGLDRHPELFGTYACDGQLAVWGPNRSDGIDRGDPLWTVRLAPLSGHGQLRTVSVSTAVFVGTAS